ncbi:unnamed protein product [Schistosoma mattheei]|uniref:Uncharacterized protein n=1 Tax=Schistosoma mattheei TaxID=31246 RepID=A0AA85BSL9_9TREM|nr:unnamed protein product [Schistosoma mattheei]
MIDNILVQKIEINVSIKGSCSKPHVTDIWFCLSEISLNLLITHYVNPRIRGISGDDEKEVLRKLQLLCRYDSEKQLQTNGKKQLGRHYKN